jgi:hypothetical protein
VGRSALIHWLPGGGLGCSGWLLLALLLPAGCSGGRQPSGGWPSAQPLPRLDRDQITALISPRVNERAAWAKAVADALQANGLAPDPPTVCAVVALIAQESGFREDPAVPGLARVVQARIDAYQEKLGPLGRPLFRRLLAARAPADPRSFESRLETVRTERDLDLVFRDLLAYYESAHPGAFGAVTLAGKLFDVRSLAQLNPITTAGPMQVSVEFAENWARDHHGQPATVRDALYTKEGGVYYGTARLFGHQAAYSKMLYRFADYNAGVYASRNAALQAQLARLTGRKLALDGDFLAYGRTSKPSDEPSESLLALQRFRELYRARLTDRRLKDDARQEKTLAFESTETYRAVKAVYAEEIGTPPDYAILPQVVLESPKLSRRLSTAWFAQSVDRRFQSCLLGAARGL